MKQKFAYVENLRIPNEMANSVCVVKICEAVAHLGYSTHLLIPKRKNPPNFSFSDIWNYYRIKKDTFFVTYFNIIELPSFPSIIEGIIKHFRFPLITWTFLFQAVYHLIKHKIDIVETTTQEVVVLLRLIPLYKPTVIYDVHVGPITWYQKMMDALLRPRVDIWMVNCQYFKEAYIKKGIDAKKIIVLPNGYDPDQYKLIASKKDIRKKLHIPTDKFIIGYVGRFETFKIEKGVSEMIKVASRLKKKIPICIVAVGGPEEYIKKYAEEARECGLTGDEVILRPQVKPNEVASYIAAFDISCMLYPDVPHFRNMMSPMKAVEYMAGGKPILSSKLPSLTQMLGDDMAYFVNPLDIMETESAILHIQRNYKEALEKAKKAREYAVQFTWVNRQKQVFELI